MLPLAFTLVMIGFANVIRTQWILPQSRDSIFVRSVSCGAVINLAANALLIPRMGAMGAVVGTLLAEGMVPVIQYLILRRELPYGRYVRDLCSYCLIGLVMLVLVRLMGRCTPDTWLGLALQAFVGAVVYGLGCLCLWMAAGETRILKMIPVVGKRLAGWSKKRGKPHDA